MNPRRLLIACFVLLLSLPAFAADDRGLYVNAKWGDSDTDASIEDVFDRVTGGKADSTAWELGWRLNNFIAFQAGYHDLGRFSGSVPCPIPELCGNLDTRIETEAVAYSLSLVPQVKLTRSLSLFGKIGVVALEGDVEAILDNRTEFLEDASEEDIIYGAGLKLSLIGRFSIFYELEYLGSNIESQYLGASFQF